ncbi:MAG: hypothetical protein AB7O91_06055 [Sphingomonas sp.]
MSDLSFQLSRSIANGRRGAAPRSREQILAALLRKRAEAHRHGQAQQEQRLRDQIAWALPIRAPAETEDA